MRGMKKYLKGEDENGRTVLRLIEGLVALVAIAVYFEFSLVLAGPLTSSGFLPNYFLSAVVSCVLLAPLVLVMLGACLGRQAFEYFERLYLKLVKRGLIEFSAGPDEDLA